jgi:hypothetical protein
MRRVQEAGVRNTYRAVLLNVQPAGWPYSGIASEHTPINDFAPYLKAYIVRSYSRRVGR